jgi:putative flavoprotein involved in K+ transport
MPTTTFEPPARSLPVLIVGSGVAGLVASDRLTGMGIAHEVVDRYGTPGGAYSRMHKRMALTSPPEYLRLAHDPGVFIGKKSVSAGEYAAYLENYARSRAIRVERREVKSVESERQGRILVSFDDTEPPRAYAAVVVCTGMFEHPVIPRIDGISECGLRSEAVPISHARTWDGPTSLSGRRVLIVGAGMSAVEIAEECVRAGAYPIVSARGGSVVVLPPNVVGVAFRRVLYPLLRLVPPSLVGRWCDDGWRYRAVDKGFATYRRSRLLEVRPEVRSLVGGNAQFVDGSIAAVDAVILATGFRFEMPFLSKSIVRSSLGVPVLDGCRSTEIPGLFFLGMPCMFGIDSHFVHGIVRDSERMAAAVRAAIARN